MQKLPQTLIGSALLGACSLAQAGTVAEVFNGEMLGTNQRYFESIAGIPRESFGDEHKFRVQGCNITATITEDTVSALRLELTPQCQADLTQFVGDYAPAPGQPLTFGAFEQASGGGLSYHADCLSGCGNSYDPSVYGHWEGPRAVDFMEVLLEAVQLAERDAPDYIEADHSKMTATFVRTPGLADVPYAVIMEPNLVIEYYAQN